MRILSLLLALALCGCASMSNGEKVYWAGAVLDTASTDYCLSRGGRELNPVLAFGGQGRGEVFLSSVIVKAGFYWLTQKYVRDKGFVLGVSGGVQAAVAGHNVGACQ